LVLDRSGSMSSSKVEAEYGLRTFLDRQREVEGECYVSLTQFDTDIDLVFRDVPIANVGTITIDPRGMTALLDAVGKTISAAADYDDLRTYLVVVTDGMENSSKEWTRGALRDLIGRKRAAGWEIVFIGADERALDDVRAMGVPMASSGTYNPKRTDVAFAATSDAVARSRTTGQSVSYTNDEREAMATPSPSTPSSD